MLGIVMSHNLKRELQMRHLYRDCKEKMLRRINAKSE